MKTLTLIILAALTALAQDIHFPVLFGKKTAKWYVDATNGSDANSGRSKSAALKTTTALWGKRGQWYYSADGGTWEQLTAIPILWDTFSVDKSAPVGSSIQMVPDAKQWIVTADTESKLSISSGALNIAGKTSPSWGDPGMFSSQNISIISGVLACRTFTSTSGVGYFGFTNSTGLYLETAPNDGMTTGDYCWLMLPGGTTLQVAKNVTGKDVGEVITSYPGYGEFGAPLTRLSLKYGLTNNNGVAALGEAKVVYLGGAFDAASTRFDLASYYTSALSAGSVASLPSADGLFEFTFTYEAGVTKNFYFRRSDGNNAIILRYDQGASTVKWIKLEGGVETTLNTKTGYAQTAGQSHTSMIKIKGSSMEALMVTPSGATSSFNVSTTGFSSDTNLTNLAQYPVVWNITPQKTKWTSAPRYFLPYGDSKTAANGLTTWPELLTAATANVQSPWKIAVGGRTTASAKAACDAELAAATVGTPDVILYNLGINDGTIDPTWDTNTAYIWDAMHTKWPSATIYVVRPWAVGNDAQYNTIASHQDALMATRAWVRAGVDERVTVKGSDNGATMTTDGVHYSTAGHSAMKSAWIAALGW